ncbi:type II secretory pathway, component PulK [Thioploca ingrica]|uniref:Type II secretion system protein K n=1 Tax=Thioploca ingrica TaxID=40754 RepID=A0A090AH20_9GAMM|nr:type II secretory pathway, component PulK [Thioploca ingrica]
MKIIVTQQGVALIIALLVVSFATLLAVAMTTRLQLDIARTANIIQGDQAYLYTLAGESWAKRILFRDGKNTTIDSLNEVWATSLLPLPLPGGVIQVQLEDLQSRFNLNNLVNNDQPNWLAITVFQRLLTVLDLPPELAAVVVDWIDSNNEPQLPNGAEENTYLAKTPAYRTANRPLRSPSEVRLLAGFDTDSYQKLLPYVTTLPTPTLININTASLPILRAVVTDLSEVNAQAIIATRQNQPFNSLPDFLVHEALAGLKVETNNLAVSSQYFLFTASVQIGRGKAQLSSILHRLPHTVQVIYRAQNTEL